MKADFSVSRQGCPTLLAAPPSDIVIEDVTSTFEEVETLKLQSCCLPAWQSPAAAADPHCAV